MSKKILVIDDEKLIRFALEKQLVTLGYRVLTAESGEEGIKNFPDFQPDAVLCDLKLPGISGIEALKNIKEQDHDMPVIMMTAFGDVKTAVEALKSGAIDYITKPFDFEELNVILSKCFETSELKKEISLLRNEQHKKYNFQQIIAESPLMTEICSIAKKVSKTNATILLLGESGTGKDLFARTIHYESLRRNKPFLEISCTAIPEHLLESELFGYEKGAFTDAKIQKKGLLELANAGTVFLNEIGHMPLSLQAKLLKLIEDKTFKRLGGTNDITVDVRIIAATNVDLQAVVAKGEFREDLFWRLNVITLILPPLRDRKEDILPLINHVLNIFSIELKRKKPKISSEAEEIFTNYHFPGNIRELRNILERILILEDTDIVLPKHLPMHFGLKKFAETNNAVETRHTVPLPSIHSPQPAVHNPQSAVGKRQLASRKPQGTETHQTACLPFEIPAEGISLEELEKSLLIQALQKTEGNQVQAAKLLGLSRDALRYRLKQIKQDKETTA